MKLKRFAAGFVAAVMALAVMGTPLGDILPFVRESVATTAGAETYGDYKYSVLADGTVEITGYTGSATEIEIPAAIDGKSVTSIGNSAFDSCTDLTSITIPDGVTSIGNSAFYWCKGLTSITIPDSVTSIGNNAFLFCTNLTSITVSENNKNYISDNGILFNKNKSELICYPAGKTDESYSIPDSVTSIVAYAFHRCEKLTSITIPSSITSISYRAFSECTGLKSITIPGSVTSIGSYAFSDCLNLTSITIPDSVTSIGNNAFCNCPSLTSITIPDSVTSIGNGAFDSCSGLTSITIPDSVTSIGDSAFSDCTGLSSITIPGSVTSIGSYAFYGCSGLKSVTIQDGVTSIGDDAFRGSGLTSIKIPSSVKRINTGAFAGTPILTKQKNYNLKYVEKWLVSCKTSASTAKIQAGTVGIADSGFYNCASLTSITIPDSVTSIGYEAFSGCSKLNSITVAGNNKHYISDNGILFNKNKSELICYPAGKTDESYAVPDGVTSIGNGAFEECTGLTSITIPDSVTSIGIYAFYNCSGLTSITIPGSVTSIGRLAFEQCTGLTSITIQDGVKSIGKQAFSDCTGLTSITIPDSVTNIENWAFSNTPFLNEQTTTVKYVGKWAVSCDYGAESAVIESGTVGIADMAFYNCSALTSITIPDSVTSIGNGAFLRCSGLEVISVSENNEYYTSVDGVLFNKNKTKLICCPASRKDKSYIIPDSVTSIEDYAFYGCSSLASVTIPDSVTYIGSKAFYGCTSLTSVTIPEGVTSIGECAFGYDGGGNKISDFKINCYTGTAGEAYAMDNDFLFDAHTHVFGDWEVTKAATCTEDGSQTRTCSDCGAVKTEAIPATGHSFGEWNITEAPTCTADGSQTRTCSDCGAVKTEAIPATGHTTATDPAVAPTCTETGLTEGSHCSVCNEVITAQETVPATGHSFGEWTIIQAATCTGDGSKTRTCSICKKSETETIAKTGHTEVIDKAVEATCTKTGLTEGSHCSVCGTVIKAQEVVPAHGHTEVIDKAVEATCTKTGLTEGSHCSVCGTVIKAQEVVPAHGHTEVIDKAVEATCTKTGLTEGSHCSVCGTVIKAQEKIAATGHKYVETVVEPSYSNRGYTLYECSVCGYSYKDNYEEQLIVPAVTGFASGSQTKSSAVLGWDKVSDADGYAVELYTGGKWNEVFRTSDSSVTSCTVGSLKADSIYSLRIRAFKDTDDGTVYSDYTRLAVKTKLAGVTGLKAQGVTATAVKLDWARNAGATGYIIEQYKGGKWTQIAVTKNNYTLTFTVKGLAECTPYSFRVKAYKNDGGKTNYSDYVTVKASTLLGTVKNAKVTLTTGTWITLGWDRNTGATGYVLEQYKGGKWTEIAVTKNNTTLSFTVKGLRNDTTYSFRIKAYKTVGDTTTYGSYVRIVGTTDIPNVAGFTGSAVSQSAVKLSWSRNDKAEGYIIEQYKGGRWTEIKAVDSDVTEITVEKLAKGTPYTFRIKSVRTVDGADKSSDYASVRVTTGM